MIFDDFGSLNRVFSHDLGDDRVHQDDDLRILRKREKSLVAPVLKRSLSDLDENITSTWQVDPFTGQADIGSLTYVINVGDLVKISLGEENYLVIPDDITSQNPTCEEFNKLEISKFCAIEDQVDPNSVITPSMFANIGRYDLKTQTFTKNNQRNFLLNPSGPQSTAGYILEQQTLDYFTFPDTISYQDIEESANPGFGVLPEFEINYFYNMLKSLIVFFSGVIQDSKMFDTEVMQIFKIEPRSTNNNAIAIDKVVKGLMDFDDAFKRAQEFFNENCSFTDINPDDTTPLQQAGTLAVLLLTIRIYVIDMFMRGVFLLDTVLTDEVGDTLFEILYLNLQEDMSQMSPEYFDSFMAAIQKTYETQRKNDPTLPETTEQKQILKYFMNQEIKLMNISLQEVFKTSFKSVKRAFLEMSPLFDYQRYSDVILYHNDYQGDPDDDEDNFADQLTQTGAIQGLQTSPEGSEDIYELLDNVREATLTTSAGFKTPLETIKPGFYLKRFFLDAADNATLLPWNETSFNKSKFENLDSQNPDARRSNVGLDLCYFDRDPDAVAKTEYENGSPNYVVTHGGLNIKIIQRENYLGDNNYYLSVYYTNDTYTTIEGGDIVDESFSAQGTENLQGIRQELAGLRVLQKWAANVTISVDGTDPTIQPVDASMPYIFWLPGGKKIANEEILKNDDPTYASDAYFTSYRTALNGYSQILFGSDLYPFDQFVDDTPGPIKDLFYIWLPNGMSPIYIEKDDAQFTNTAFLEKKVEYDLDFTASFAPFFNNWNSVLNVSMVAIDTAFEEDPQIQEYYVSQRNALMQPALDESYDAIGASEMADGTPLEISQDDVYLGSFVSFPIVRTTATLSDYIYDNSSITVLNGLSRQTWPNGFRVLKHNISIDSNFKTFFRDCIPAESLYDVMFTYIVTMTSRYVPSVENIFKTTKQSLKTAFDGLAVEFRNFDYMDGDILEKGGPSGMLQNETTNMSTTPDVSAMATKMAAMTPFMIIKGLAEQFDPNIKIAKFIRQGALLAGVDLPIQLASAGVMIPPVFGPGIIPGPLGLIYLATEFLEPKERERTIEIKEGVNTSRPPTLSGEYEVTQAETEEDENLSVEISEEELDPRFEQIRIFNDVMEKVWEILYDNYTSFSRPSLLPAQGFIPDTDGIPIPNNTLAIGDIDLLDISCNKLMNMIPNIDNTLLTYTQTWVQVLLAYSNEGNVRGDVDQELLWEEFFGSQHNGASRAKKESFANMCRLWLAYHSAWNYFWKVIYLAPLEHITLASLSDIHMDYNDNLYVFQFKNTARPSSIWNNVFPMLNDEQKATISSNPQTIEPLVEYIYNYTNENTVINNEATQITTFTPSGGSSSTYELDWEWNVHDIIDSMKPVFTWSQSMDGSGRFLYTDLEKFQDKLQENPFGIHIDPQNPSDTVLWTNLEDKLPPLYYVFPLPINPNIGS